MYTHQVLVVDSLHYKYHFYYHHIEYRLWMVLQRKVIIRLEIPQKKLKTENIFKLNLMKTVFDTYREGIFDKKTKGSNQVPRNKWYLTKRLLLFLSQSDLCSETIQNQKALDSCSFLVWDYTMLVSIHESTKDRT